MASLASLSYYYMLEYMLEALHDFGSIEIVGRAAGLSAKMGRWR